MRFRWQAIGRAVSVAVMWGVCVGGVARGDNGSVVVASVVRDITVDGSLDDWPRNAPRHAIGLNLYGDPDVSPGDGIGEFMVGVDPEKNRVYIAISFSDDSRVTEPKGHRSWKSFDAPTTHLGLPTLRGDASAPEMVPLPAADIAKRNRRTRHSNVHTQEVCYDLGAADHRVGSPIVAALTVGINDRDEDGSFTVKFWSPEITKSLHRERRGDLVICGNERGRLRGRVTNGIDPKRVGTLLIEFEELSNPLFRLRLRTDAEGAYDVELPPGTYLRTGKNLAPNTLTVAPGMTSTDNIRHLRSTPKVMQLANYEAKVRAAPGYAQLLFEKAGASYYEMNKLSGLPSSNVLSLAQDEVGALWIGTFSQLARFDGSQLRVYDEDFLTEIRGLWHDERADRLWVAARNRVGYISNGEFTTFPLLDDRHARCVHPTHDGRICIGTKSGLFLWDGRGFTFQSKRDGVPDGLVNAVAPDLHRNVTWVGTNQGLSSFDGNRHTVYSVRDGLSDPRIVSLFVDSRGKLWVGTASALFQFKDDRFHLIRKHESERVSYARSFTEQDDGTVVVGTYDGTVMIPPSFPDTPYRFQAESSENQSVFFDRDLQLWQGFEDGTLRRNDLGMQRIYPVAGRCRFLHVVGDKLWFSQTDSESPESRGLATRWSVVRYDTVTKQTKQFRIQLGDANERPVITAFSATANGIWAGTKSHGVFRLVDGEWQRVDLPVDSYSEVASLFEDSQQRLWIVTTRRVFMYQDGEVKPQYIPSCPQVADFIHVAESPRGLIAFATTAGVFILDGDKLVDRHDESSGMISNVALDLVYDEEGTLWVATFYGIQGISGESSVVFTAANGLLDDYSATFLAVCGGEVWSGSNAGVNRISKKRDIVQHLLGNDGLGRNKIYSVVAAGTTKWLAGDSGIWSYRGGKHPPRVSIDDVVTDEPLGPREEIDVTTDLKSIEFRFNATSLKNRKGGMIYRYRLIGGSQGWEQTQEPRIALSVPRAGTYQLELVAVDRDLLSSKPAFVKINVRPPFGRLATQFGLVAATAASIVLGLLFYSRVRQENVALERSVEERTAQLTDLERRLQHAQKMEALGTLASGVAHDFNNSLLAINGNAELALLSETVAEKDELIGEVLAVTDQATGLTRSMLLFGGKTSSQKRNVDIRSAVREAEKILRRTLPASIKFHCSVPNTPVYCESDEHQIQQMVLNLALNARDAMPGGGGLAVKVEHSDRSINLTVKDDGHGMTQNTQDRIFEPFYTEKARGKGTGLGLSVVHAIVKDHGGEIKVTSRPGTGTEFCVTLPAQPYGERSEPLGSASLASSQGRVLLADDEVQVRRMLAEALTRAGFYVETVGNGEEFVERFVHSGDFDLVIVDVDMPGKNGWASLEEVRRLRHNISAIVISGLPVTNRRFDGGTTFIRKPFSLRDFTECASRLTAAKSERAFGS